MTIVEDLATYKELLVAGGRHNAAPQPDQVGRLHPAPGAEAGPAAPLHGPTGSGNSGAFSSEHELGDRTASGLQPTGAAIFNC